MCARTYQELVSIVLQLPPGRLRHVRRSEQDPARSEHTPREQRTHESGTRRVSGRGGIECRS